MPQHILTKSPSPTGMAIGHVYPSSTSDPIVKAHTTHASMDVSKLERLTVLQMREAMREEYVLLMSNLMRAEDRVRKLTSDNRFFEAWNNDLIGVLHEHGIDIPAGPESQYPGTPSTCDDN